MLLYFHGGSKNHGCEAIIRSISSVLGYIDCYTFEKSDDLQYGLDACVNLKQIDKYKRGSLTHIAVYAANKVLGAGNFVMNGVLSKIYKDFINQASDVAISVGGDTYCYKNSPEELALINKGLNDKGVKTVLLGCSIEPSLLKNKAVVEDMKRYALITARESITYEALLDAGLTNVALYPDSAFMLKKQETEYPEGFFDNNTVGINVSPLIMRYEKEQGIAIKNYISLVNHILKTTDLKVALIPHVVWAHDDDRKPLSELYNEVKDTGRVIYIEDNNCMALKSYISACRMFIGARTHATIAAYSSCVPTLVVGYSIKAKGIAKDLFNTYDNYCLPVQALESSDDLIRAFEWLKENEDGIRTHLTGIMPDYIKRAQNVAEEIKKLQEIK